MSNQVSRMSHNKLDKKEYSKEESRKNYKADDKGSPKDGTADAVAENRKTAMSAEALQKQHKKKLAKMSKKLGKFFLDARLRTGLTYEQVEQRSGIGSKELQLWEQGLRSPRANDAAKVVLLFGDEEILAFQRLFNEMLAEGRSIRQPSV